MTDNFQILVLSDCNKLPHDALIDTLGELTPDHIQLIAVLGDVSPAVLLTCSETFPKALITLMTDHKPPAYEDSWGVEQGHLKTYNSGSGFRMFCVGGNYDWKNQEERLPDCEAEILISRYAPRNINLDEEEQRLFDRRHTTFLKILNSGQPFNLLEALALGFQPSVMDAKGRLSVSWWGAKNRPRLVLHGGRDENRLTVTGSGMKIQSIYGAALITLTQNEEGLDYECQSLTEEIVQRPAWNLVE